MTIEKYNKSKGGKPYFNIYYRFGKVLVRVEDIQTDNEEDAIKKAGYYLEKALNESKPQG